MTNVTTPGPVLIVDDSPYSRRRIRRFLANAGIVDVVEATDGESAVALHESVRPGLVVMDLVMRGRDGLDVVRELMARHPTARVVVLTVLSDPEVHRQARAAGALGVLQKDELERLGSFLGTDHAA